MSSSRLVAALGALCLLVALPGCRRVETDTQRPGAGLTLVYSANIMGEIEPCG